MPIEIMQPASGKRVRVVLINYVTFIKTIEDENCLFVPASTHRKQLWLDETTGGVWYKLDPKKFPIPIEDTLIYVPPYSIISISFK